MFKKLLFWGIVLVFCSSFLFGQTPIAPASGGGSEDNPYQISSLENVYWIAGNSSNWQFHYVQANDINASETYMWFNGLGWY